MFLFTHVRRPFLLALARSKAQSIELWPLVCRWPLVMSNSPASQGLLIDSSLRARRSLTSPSGSEIRMASKPKSIGLDYHDLESGHSDLGPDLWYVLAGITLMAVGRQHLISELWGYLAGSIGEPQFPQGEETEEPLELQAEDLLMKARRLREGLMKASLLVGYPRAINALNTLYTSQSHLAEDPTNERRNVHSIVLARLVETPSTRPFLNPTHSPTNDTPPHTPLINNYYRGLSLFNTIYTPTHTPRLIDSMSRCSSSDLSNYAISRIYGDILSDFSLIKEKETGLICFASCLSLALVGGEEELGLAAQVKGHMYGAKNLGASGKEVRATEGLVKRIWEVVRRREGEAREDVEVEKVLRKNREW